MNHPQDFSKSLIPQSHHNPLIVILVVIRQLPPLPVLEPFSAHLIAPDAKLPHQRKRDVKRLLGEIIRFVVSNEAFIDSFHKRQIMRSDENSETGYFFRRGG